MLATSVPVIKSSRFAGLAALGLRRLGDAFLIQSDYCRRAEFGSPPGNCWGLKVSNLCT